MPDPLRRNPASHAAILGATIEQLNSVGYHRLTIERVASQAGVGKATVYRWWPTKARLVVEALSRRYEFEPVVSTGDVRTEVRAIVERAMEFMYKTPIGLTLPQLVGDLDGEPETRSMIIDWLGPARAAHLAVLYGAAGRADLPHNVDVQLLLDVIAGTVLYRGLLGRQPDEFMIDQLTDLVVGCNLPRVGTADGRLV